MHLVDTNVISEFLRPRPAPAVLNWARTVDRFALSVVTVEEVTYGLSAKPNAQLERGFENLVRDYCTVLPVTDAIARRCGELRGRLSKNGRTRTQADMLIAATAAEHDLVVVSRKVRDFEGCGVRVLNPF